MSFVCRRVNPAPPCGGLSPRHIIAIQERPPLTHERVIWVEGMSDVEQLRWEVDERHRAILIDDKLKPLKRLKRRGRDRRPLAQSTKTTWVCRPFLG
mgnify:CR=1 FL=1